MEEDYIEEIVEKYSDMVMRIAYQNCFNKSDSEDIVQEVFIKLIKNINKLDKNSEYIKAWIIRVAINTCKDCNKSGWYKNIQELENNFEFYFEKEELGILNMLKKLKPTYRNIIYLYYYEGYKIKEISNILKMRENTVSSNLTRARKELKDVLEGGELYEG